MAIVSLLIGPPAIAEPRISISPRRPLPGDAVLLTVTGVPEQPVGRAAGHRLQFFVGRDEGWQAVFAVPLDDPPAAVRIDLAGDSLDRTVMVGAREFAEEEITVTPELAEPDAALQRKIDADNDAVVRALAADDSPPRFRGRFTRLLSGAVVTSTFGAWRRFNGSAYRSRHLGLDRAARAGAPVRSVAPGVVVLTLDSALMGRTVVLSHGAGIGSVYFHLGDIAVAAGDEVDTGKVVGRAGETGRTTGPHLHVGIWVPGGFVDPVRFARLPLAPAPANARI